MWGKLSDDSQFCNKCGASQTEKQKKSIPVMAAIAVIIALLVVGVVLVGNKTPTEITLEHENPLNPIDGLNVKLSDDNGGITSQLIEVTIKNDAGTYEYTGTTDAQGIAAIELNDIDDGIYTAECEYKGNGEYKSSSATDMVEIENTVRSTTAPAGEPDYRSYYYTNSFEDTDTNGDGYVTLSDMNIVHTPEPIRNQMYSDSDDDNDGRLNSDEYYKFMYKLNYDSASYGL